MDPTFDLESFTRELREYIVPELVDAYLSADRDALKMWCGEAVWLFIVHLIPPLSTFIQTYNVLWATMEQYLKQGLISDSKVLDIRNVDVRFLSVFPFLLFFLIIAKDIIGQNP